MNLPRVKVVERHYWTLEIESDCKVEDWYKNFDSEEKALEEAEKLVRKEIAIIR